MGTLGVICVFSAGMLTVSWDCGGPPLPCPKFNWKDLLAFIAAALGAFIYLSVLGLRNPLTSIDVVACNVVGVALGRFIKKVFCPIPIK
jgi:hypothetical protein